MNELASACEWFQVMPDFTASMVASLSHESRIVAQPKSFHRCEVGSAGAEGALASSGV